MPARARLPIVLDEIGDAMDRPLEDPAEPLLDRATGDVVWVPSDDSAELDDPDLLRALEGEPERFLPIPRLGSRDEYRWMADFAWSIDDDDEARVRLTDALDGRGAFGRFRGVPLRIAHVVILGEGDRSVVDGFIRRSVDAGAGRARAIFEILARDLCATAGVDWRNRFVDGKSTFEREGTRLSIDGDAVHVDVAIPPEVVRCFDPAEDDEAW